MRRLTARRESWKLARPFVISRARYEASELVIVEIVEDGIVGRGEAAPIERYGQDPASVLAAIESIRTAIEDRADRAALQMLLPAGAARNAIDCALWDLEAKQRDVPAWQLAGVGTLRSLRSVMTISLDAPEMMAAQAASLARYPILKLKLGGAGDLERVAAVASAAPHARLVVDANEAWTVDLYKTLAGPLGQLGVEMIEQPFPQELDSVLDELDRPVPVCADESCHTAEDIDHLIGRYDLINIKLDKTGGLTEALRLSDLAHRRGLGVMVGCMSGTSLGMAPAHLVAQRAAYVDLDGPLLLATDRQPGLRYDGTIVHPPESALWG